MSKKKNSWQCRKERRMGAEMGRRVWSPRSGNGLVTTESRVFPSPLIPHGHSFFIDASGFHDSPLGRLSEWITPWIQIASCFCAHGFLCQWYLPPKPKYHQWELPPPCLMMPSSLYQQEVTPLSLPCIFIKPSSYQVCKSQTYWEVIFL